MRIDIYLAETCGSYHSLRENLERAISELRIAPEISFHTVYSYDEAVALNIKRIAFHLDRGQRRLRRRPASRDSLKDVRRRVRPTREYSVRRDADQGAEGVPLTASGRFRCAPGRHATIRFMKNLIFIGDSLTQWCDWERRFPHHRVMNLGISGETVEGLLGRSERIHAAVSAPDYLFLMTGVNNIANEQYEIIAPYREIVRRLATWYKQAVVVVQSILPVDLAWIDSNMIAATNRMLARLAEELGAEYLDLYRRFLGPGDRPKSGLLSDDGVHLAAAGYDVWSEEVGSFLARRG